MASPSKPRHALSSAHALRPPTHTPVHPPCARLSTRLSASSRLLFLFLPSLVLAGLLAVGDAASFAAPQAPSELRADVLTWRRENSPITGPVAVLDADVRWCDAALPPPAVRASRWHIWANWGGGVTWLGVAHQPVFGVRGLRLPGECVRVRFYVQPESWDGETFSRRGSPSVAVAFPSPL